MRAVNTVRGWGVWPGLASVALFGCTANQATAAADAGDDAADTVACVADGGPYAVDTYTSNLQKEGRHGLLKFDLVQADPAPPAQGLNSFVLKISRQDGTPFTGQLDFLQPFPQGVFMPLHNHGPSSPIPTIAFDPSQGAYVLSQMNFIMPGLWRVTVNAYDTASPADAGAAEDDEASTSTPATPTDVGVFYFCVD